MSTPLLVLLGTFLCVLLMFVLWLVSLRTKNAGIVDPGWAACLVLLALVDGGWGGGDVVRRLFISLMVFAWGTRLASHLAIRISRDPQEDSRYQKMRRDLGGRASFFFLLFFEFQAVVAVILSAPFLIASLDPDPRIHAAQIAGSLLWALSFAGESLADRQLKKFKANPANRGKVCQDGLWNYSRHPNYFFECLIWVSYFIFASASPWGFVAALSPVLMIFLIAKMSGVPPAEEASLKSRGEAYRRYQQTTSVLIPWFKKKV